MSCILRKVGFTALFVILFAGSLRGRATLTVCASGCTYTTIQAAVTAAVSGDVISIRANETFVGSVTIPNKGTLAIPIIIRSDTADGNLPPADTRPDDSTLSTYQAVMPDIQASAGGIPAFKFDLGARDYVLLGLEFKANPAGFDTVIEVGDATDDQQFFADQPQNIVIDRIIIRGDPVFGQKVGIDLSGRNLTVKNSYIDRIAAMGQDSSAIRLANASGPITIINNYLSAAAENFLSGGLDPQMRTFAQVSAGATTTQATLTAYRAGHTIATLSVGDLVAFLAGGGTTRYHTIVRSIAGDTITYDATPAAPDTGALSDVRWGRLPENVTFRRNHVRKDPAWMGPILGTMAQPTVTAVTGTGTLAAGTYCYRAVARNNAGYNNNNVWSAAAAEKCATLSATGHIDLSWSAHTNATHYRMYGRTSGSVTGYIETTGLTVTDTGAALTAGSINTSSKWQAKNLFEIKFGRNFQIDSNIFEIAFPGTDIGYAIWLKSNNTDNNCEFCQTKDIVFEKNIIRHVDGAFNILGKNDGGAESPAQIENLTIRNNLIYDSNTAWNQGGATVYAIKAQRPTKNLTFSHNTFIHQMRGFMYLTTSSTGPYHENLVVTDNLARHETYGVFSTSCVKGTECLVEQTLGYTFAGNVLAGAPSSTYPAGNLYPTVTEFENTHFENYGGGVDGDYTLKAESTWRATATDGTDRGANISQILAATAGVEDGTPESSVPAVSITTVGLSDGTQNVAYSAQLGASGGTTPYTWVVSSGTLPTGLTLSTGGLLSGTPTTVQNTSFTVQVTDAASTVDTQPLTLDINAAPTPPSITTASPLPSATVPVAYSTTLSATGGAVPYTWDISAGSLPTGLTLSTDGILSGTPQNAGAANFTARVTDLGGVTATKAFVLTVNAESRPCNRPVRWNLTEVAVFRRPTQPTVTDCVITGDIWINTSFNPATVHVATSATPTFSPVQVGSAHSLLSHSDSASPGATASAGDLIVGTDENQWTKLPAGADGTVLTSAGGTLSWETPTGGSGGGGSGTAGVQMITIYAGIATTSSNIPSGGYEFPDGVNRNRVRPNFTGITQCAMMFYHTASGTSGTRLKIQYWDGSAWADSGIDWLVGTSAGLKEGTYQTLAAGARNDLQIIRAFLYGGDGVIDVPISNIHLTCKP